MFDQRVTRSILRDSGPLFDSEHRRTSKQPAGGSNLRDKTDTSFQTGFAGTFRENDIDPELGSHAIAHCLYSALCLLWFARIECQTELAESTGAEIKFSVERLQKPSAAVVGAEDGSWHNE